MFLKIRFSFYVIVLGIGRGVVWSSRELGGRLTLLFVGETLMEVTCEFGRRSWVGFVWVFYLVCGGATEGVFTR